MSFRIPSTLLARCSLAAPSSLRALARTTPLRITPLHNHGAGGHTTRFSLCDAHPRLFSSLNALRIEHRTDTSHSKPSHEVNNDVSKEEEEHYERELEDATDKQIRTPWHRDGSDKPPVERESASETMTKGKLLTTPSRMLKLILPLPSREHSQDDPNTENVEPLALLVHPQQPLSYLERLIQSELPTIRDGDKERIPYVYFRAENSMQDAIATPASKGMKGKSDKEKEAAAEEAEEEAKQDSEEAEAASKGKEKKKAKEHDKPRDPELDGGDEMSINGEVVKTGKLRSEKNKKGAAARAALRGGPGEGGVESYSGAGQDAKPSSDQKRNKTNFVRWSTSTEIGDFIRDAARGKEFSVEIEGAPHDIRVGVPSFNDRTFYLRMRLRSTSRKISGMADVKRECDRLAHKTAQRVAVGGLGVMCAWWYVVYVLTFRTELGWDTMEPVTYLVGLSTLMGGYVWFLYHNREVSYRSAMNITISQRQSKLYAAKGFDLDAWQNHIEEGNALRKEIKLIANEYDVEWNEREDEFIDEKVTEELRKEREKQKKKGKKKDDEDGDDD